MFDCLRLLFTKGTQRVCGGVEEIGVGFQQQNVASSNARKEDRVRTVANGPPNTSAVREFAGGGSTSVPRMSRKWA